VLLQISLIRPAIFRTGNLSIKIEYYRTKYNLGQKNSFGKIPAPLNPLF